MQRKNRLPAEWSPQEFVIMSFPRSDGDYGILTNEVAIQHLALACCIAQFTPVLMVVADLPLFNLVSQRIRKNITTKLKGPEFQSSVLSLAWAKHQDIQRCTGFEFPLFRVELATNDVWARDFGPLTICDGLGNRVVLDFTFNGWGNKYPAELDNAITRQLHHLGVFGAAQLQSVDLVLEGGGIESDGAGTIMATRQCLFNNNRNPNRTEAEIMHILKTAFNAKELLLVEHGYLENDDTDAHIDTIVRFAPNNVIVYQACDDPSDPHYTDFRAMAEQLRSFTNAEGQAYTCLPLPWPEPVYSRIDGRRLPASYANFLVTNGAVIVPAINKKSDPEAVAVLQRAFPDHLIVLQPTDYLLEQYGSIHCLTMQFPASQGSQAAPAT